MCYIKGTSSCSWKLLASSLQVRSWSFMKDTPLANVLQLQALDGNGFGNSAMRPQPLGYKNTPASDHPRLRAKHWMRKKCEKIEISMRRKCEENARKLTTPKHTEKYATFIGNIRHFFTFWIFEFSRIFSHFLAFPPFVSHWSVENVFFNGNSHQNPLFSHFPFQNQKKLIENIMVSSSNCTFLLSRIYVPVQHRLFTEISGYAFCTLQGYVTCDSPEDMK